MVVRLNEKCGEVAALNLKGNRLTGKLGRAIWERDAVAFSSRCHDLPYTIR